MHSKNMKLKEYIKLNKDQLDRFQKLNSQYLDFYHHPETCTPKIIINTPVEGLASWEERINDPYVMLQTELDSLRPHIEIEDDRVPSVRVQFGTAQIAAAFGCDMHLSKDNLPAAANSILNKATDVHELKIPDNNAGWYCKLEEWTKIWKENLPQGIHIQHPDIQSPFNSAHLIRGNEIFTDFYEYPDELRILLSKVTTFMINIVLHTKAMISDDKHWFYDWGAYWKGTARISNCSMQMISPEMYREFVQPYDIELFNEIGGGRVHYCGLSAEVINEYFNLPLVYGLDFDSKVHDFFDICQKAPQHISLISTEPFKEDHKVIQELLRGNWPEKRDITIFLETDSIDSGKKLLQELRRSIPKSLLSGKTEL